MEGRRLEGGAPDESAIHIGTGKEFIRIGRLAASTIQQANGSGHFRIIRFGQPSPDGRVHFLGLFGGGSQSGANGPDRLIGYHHVGHGFGRQMEDAGLELAQDLVEMDVALAVLQALTTTEDHTKAGFEDAVDLVGDPGIIVPMAVPPFAVADDHILHTASRQHLRREFSGLGPRTGGRDIL